MNREYSTSDRLLTIALIAKGHEVLRVETTTGRFKLFVFRSTDGLRDDESLFWKRKLDVEPYAFDSAIKQWKGQVFNV